jgi:hypothetical protein
MDINRSMDQKTNTFRVFYALFLLMAGLLFVAAYKEYKGETYVYILFTVISNVLLIVGFRRKAIFFDTFIGVFFWLGFWLKFSVRIAFMDGEFHNPIGNFDSSSIAYDRALLVASCSFMGLLLASFLREKWLFIYPSKIKDCDQQGLLTFYQKYRSYVLLGFVVLIMAVAATNIYFGIYQRGSITGTTLPYGLNGIYKWLLLFGLASITAVILKFEYLEAKKTSYLVAMIGLFETFVSNVSLLSRGMVLNTGALVYGTIKSLNTYEIKSNIRFLLVCFSVFIILFASSVLAVNYFRTISSDEYNERSVLNSSQVLFLDRWVGIEAVMATSSYHEQGWPLWQKAWQEKYDENETSFYDLNLIQSPYINTDKEKHHYISLPGIVAFCFYPGSYIFLFFCMTMIGLLSGLIEIFVFKFGGKNLILSALLAQVIAYRFASFGYVPSQTYLLFGAVFMNIILIYILNKLLVYWYNR